MEKLYTMKKASELLGLTVRYLQMLDKEGKIKCVRTLGGRRRVPEEEIRRLRGVMARKKTWVIYARVSSNKQKQEGDLGRQIEYVKKSIGKEDNDEIIVITDVASGLNDHRKGLLRLMNLVSEGKVTDVAIATKDRLTRFGFRYIEEFFKGFGVEIHVKSQKNKKSLEEELVEDMLSIVTSFSGKLYGIRSAKRKKLMDNIKEIVENN